MLSSLPTRVCRKLCDALDCKTVIGSNWHDFADHLNFSQAMMQKLEERDEKMKEIFYYMQHKERKIGDVVEILSSIERKDCLQFLNEAGVKGLPDYTGKHLLYFVNLLSICLYRNFTRTIRFSLTQHCSTFLGMKFLVQMSFVM